MERRGQISTESQQSLLVLVGGVGDPGVSWSSTQKAPGLSALASSVPGPATSSSSDPPAVFALAPVWSVCLSPSFSGAGGVNSCLLPSTCCSWVPALAVPLEHTPGTSPSADGS